MRSKWKESVYEYILRSEQQYWEPLQCSVNLTLTMFVLFIWGSPVYITWNPRLLSSGASTNANSERDTFSDGVLISEDVAGQQWMRPSAVPSWALPIKYPILSTPHPEHSPSLPHPEHSPLEVVSPSSSMSLPWGEDDQNLDLKALRGLGWSRQRNRVWTCELLLPLHLEPNEKGRLGRAGRSSNNLNQVSGQLHPSKNLEHTLWC